VGVFDLGLTSRQFWALTFKEYHALIQRWQTEQDIQFLNSGIIASTIANVSLTKKRSRRFQPKDFIPERPKTYAQAGRHQVATIERLNAMFGGKDLRGKKDGNSR